MDSPKGLWLLCEGPQAAEWECLEARHLRCFVVFALFVEEEEACEAWN